MDRLGQRDEALRLQGSYEGFEAMCRVLVEYGTRAPSPHNTQPWRFEADRESRELRVFLDRSRSMLAIDPFGHEAHIALGGVIENIEQAQRAWGMSGTVSIFPDPTHSDLVAAIRLAETRGSSVPNLSDSVFSRTTFRGRFTKERPPKVFSMRSRSSILWRCGGFQIRNGRCSVR